ncbi:MAG: NUDIX hydrolase [Deltaproteobacteria bacterium]|nr:NUDIX hydrolase [Deltaproteobacteria bacterium]
MHWTIDNKKSILKTIPFEVEELLLKEGEREFSHPYYRLLCPDWVNVLPITQDGEAILVRQDRAGSQTTVLETPGGVLEQHEYRDPTLAAVRELEEETGYSSRKVLFLSSYNPNPALQNNRIHFFLALDCFLEKDRRHFPDEEEKIEVVKIKATELDEFVRFGKIDHALSALCICLSGKYVKIKP